jgi:hypothetical protein
MSTTRPRAATHSASSGSVSRSSKHSARVITQTPVDAKLQAEFEESVHSFDYTKSIDISGDSSSVPSETVKAYLQRLQREMLIQPFGCVLAVEEGSCAVVGYSENAPEMLDVVGGAHAVPSIGGQQQEGGGGGGGLLRIGMDARTLFKPASAAALQKAATFADMHLVNPIFVRCNRSGKPFYAILNRIDAGLVIDFEPVMPPMCRYLPLVHCSHTSWLPRPFLACSLCPVEIFGCCVTLWCRRCGSLLGMTV